MRTYGPLGPAYFSGDAASYRGMAKKFGHANSDPDAGGYHLNRVHWNSATGVGSFSTTDAMSTGWMSLNPCECGGGAPCQCP
jgi:hypothetical protein